MTGKSLHLARTEARNVLLVELPPALGDLIEQWVRARGQLAARADRADRALDLLRRLPFVAAVCEGRLLDAHPQFSERLHRTQVRTGMVVLLTDDEGALGEGAALDRGAVDTVVAPGDRDRFATAMERALDWSRPSDACVRRAITLSIERKVEALVRLARHAPASAGRPLREQAGEVQSSVPPQPSNLLMVVRQASGVWSGVEAPDGGAGPHIRASRAVLVDALAARVCLALGLDESRRPFCRDIAQARLARLLNAERCSATDAVAAPSTRVSPSSGPDRVEARRPQPGAAA